MIKATLIKKIGNLKVNFDATPWFEKAWDDQLFILAAEGWEQKVNGYGIAEFCCDFDDKLLSVFENEEGNWHFNTFLCRVDGKDAATWIQKNRPSILEDLLEGVPA